MLTNHHIETDFFNETYVNKKRIPDDIRNSSPKIHSLMQFKNLLQLVGL